MVYISSNKEDVRVRVGLDERVDSEEVLGFL